MARELHMTVRQLLENISQKELCHWIAYFKIEDREYQEKKEERQGKQSASVKVKQVDKEVTQEQKDGALLNQLLALAGKKED